MSTADNQINLDFNNTNNFQQFRLITKKVAIPSTERPPVNTQNNTRNKSGERSISHVLTHQQSMN